MFRWNVSISKCTGSMCAIKHACLRYTSIPTTYWSSYVRGAYSDGTCVLFVKDTANSNTYETTNDNRATVLTGKDGTEGSDE